MEKIIKPIKISRTNFNTYGDLISTDDINPIDIKNTVIEVYMSL